MRELVVLSRQQINIINEPINSLISRLTEIEKAYKTNPLVRKVLIKLVPYGHDGAYEIYVEAMRYETDEEFDKRTGRAMNKAISDQLAKLNKMRKLADELGDTSLVKSLDRKINNTKKGIIPNKTLSTPPNSQTSTPSKVLLVGVDSTNHTTTSLPHHLPRFC